MGITERIPKCICIVVSEETGSISVAERGVLNRPLTSTTLREILEARFTVSVESEAATPRLRQLGKQIAFGGFSAIAKLWKRTPAIKNMDKEE
jgi:hypothetical protein